MYRYTIPEKFLGYADEDFLRTFLAEYHRVSGVSADDYTFALTGNEDTSGWAEAFVSACRKLGKDELFEYWYKIDYWEQEKFGSQITELLVKNGLLFERGKIPETAREDVFLCEKCGLWHFLRHKGGKFCLHCETGGSEHANDYYKELIGLNKEYFNRVKAHAKNRKQVYNPFLPVSECIPDGEPHVFGDRVYLYGSHDKEGGETFCMLDYTVYSAPVTDLSDWRCEGVIYRAEQDPDYKERPFMYAPDAVRGNDGRYYLYYCMSGKDGVGGYFGPISVAVCDTPAGKYEYLGYVRNKDGTPVKKYVCFDPAALNDNGNIYIYYGTQYDFEEREDFGEGYIKTETEMFNKSREEIIGTKDSVMGPVVVTLEDDMLTVKEEARHIIPYKVKGTDFEAHPFFEASSMRKVGGMYYFVYSSQKNHELCYATSEYPDRDFAFGGTIVSNGDVGYNGRRDEDRLNMTGTTHGSIEQINGLWYVFYHRLTHKSDYSRQACAERIAIYPDGSIPQVEITSCGLNGGALRAEGEYPAVIACNITNGRMPHGSNSRYTESFPNCTHRGEDRFIGEISDGTLIGYKYYDFEGGVKLTLTVRSTGSGRFDILKETDGEVLGSVDITPADDWTEFSAKADMGRGVYPLYLKYSGEGNAELKIVTFG